jgi:hypothetical protein
MVVARETEVGCPSRGATGAVDRVAQGLSAVAFELLA